MPLLSTFILDRILTLVSLGLNAHVISTSRLFVLLNKVISTKMFNRERGLTGAYLFVESATVTEVLEMLGDLCSGDPAAFFSKPRQVSDTYRTNSWHQLLKHFPNLPLDVITKVNISPQS